MRAITTQLGLIPFVGKVTEAAMIRDKRLLPATVEQKNSSSLISPIIERFVSYQLLRWDKRKECVRKKKVMCP